MAKKKSEPRAKGPAPNQVNLEGVRPIPKRQIEEFDRLHILLQLSHEHCCVDPTQVSARFTALLTVKEQPYKRNVKVTKDWTPLLKGCWLTCEEIGYLVIQNNGSHRSLKPTKEEEEQDKKKILQIAIKVGGRYEPVGRVNPKRIALLENDNSFHNFFIRAIEEVEATVTMFPK